MIKNIVIAGGAIKTIALIGCISRLEDDGIINLKTVDTYIGSSAGSIISLLLCLGYNSKSSYTILHGLMKSYNEYEMSADCLFKMINSYGIDEGNFITRWMIDLINDTIQLYDPTIIEFVKKTGKNINICATNITEMKYEVFNVNTFPNVKIVDVIRASISIPILFTPVIIDDNFYIDSGALNNFPIDFVNFTNLSSFDTIGLCVKVTKNKEGITNILTFLQQICLTVSNNHSVDNPIIKEKKIHIIEVDVKDDNFLSFDMNTFKLDISTETFETFFKIGYDYTIADFNHV